MGIRENGLLLLKQALFLLLKRFLYAAILITTNKQRPANAEPKTKRSPASDSLMMSIAATPLSNYLKN
jgi:hypothetical protein